ncbi:MAG: DUF1707 domain-containing protein [Solirubrobacterales bacterium]|nr:DUF1707 domain-containing protein [Solirubrobacterales bacterium]
MTNQYSLDRIAGRNANLRAADADREHTAERLRESHSEGRLDMDEFQQRLERCYQAKTIGELDELVNDLPRQAEHAEQPPLGWFRPSGSRVAPLAAIVIALIVISAAIGHHLFWLWLPLVFLLWRMSSWRRRRPWAGARRGPNGWI